MIDKLELKRAQTEKIAKVVLFIAIVGGGFLISPFIFSAIKGLVGLLVFLGILVVSINLAPSISKRLANYRLKLLKAEAAKNPIETLENQYRDREEALGQFRENIKQFHGAVLSFRSVILEHKEKYPENTLYDEQYAKMVLLLRNREAKYKQVQAKLLDFDELIGRKRSEWKLAQIAIQTNKAAGVGEDFMSRLLKDEAVNSVTDSLNSAFSELQVSLLDEVDPAAAATIAGAVTGTPKNVTPSKPKSLPSVNEKITLDLDFLEVDEKV